MDAVAERFIELCLVQHYRPLTDAERDEFHESYHCLIHRWWRVAELKNMSLAAYMAGDVDWHHEVCAELERLERR